MRHPNEFGPPPPPPPPSPSVFLIFLNITNTVTNLFLGGAVTCSFLFVIVWNNILSLPINITSQLSTHVCLCVIGYIIIMAQGVLGFSSHAGWGLSLRYEDKKIVHLAMQVGGAVLALIGSSIRIAERDNNFESAHGILGLVAMILTIISLIGGAVNLCLSSIVFTKIIHSCAGSLTMLFAFLSLCFGFDRREYREVMGDDIANYAIGLTVVGLVGVQISAVISNIKRITNR